jgi:pimeloyl-ACP methyl ester carboxylesterase
MDSLTAPVDASPSIEYDETGVGPTIVFVPGSLSTGAAWKGIVSRLGGGFRVVTTSLLGNGRTTERRSPSDVSIRLQVDALEYVVRRAGGPVHLVTHSYGGVAALALVLARHIPLASLFMIEPNPADVLRQAGDLDLYQRFRTMSEAYAHAFARGEKEAIARVVDFYDGPGTYVASPARVREYLVAFTRSNILDWATMYGFDAALADYAAISAPTVIVRGMRGHPGMLRIAEILQAHIAGAELVSVEDAGHFMLATHAQRLAPLIAAHVQRAEAR